MFDPLRPPGLSWTSRMRSSRSMRPAPRKALAAIFREPELVVEAMGNWGCRDDGGWRLSGRCSPPHRCGTSLSQRSHVTQVFPNRGGSLGETRAETEASRCGVSLGFDSGVKSPIAGVPCPLFFLGHGNKKIRRWPPNIISHSLMPFNIPSLSHRPSIPLTTSPSRSPPSNTRTSS